MTSKTCIVFYGIGRNKNLNREIAFYRRVFDKSSFIYFLYSEELIYNPRSNESGAIDYSFLKNLDIPIVPVIMDQFSSFNDILSRSIDPHNDGRKSLNNLLKQLLMLNQIASHFTVIDDYVNFFVIRDDVKFSVFSKLFLLLCPPIPSNNSEIIVSAFSWHGGINDKFFISSRRVMLLICQRVNQMKEFIEDRGYLNAEHLLKYILSLEELKVVPVFLNVGRVRIDGKVLWDKFLPAITRPKDIYRILCIITINFFNKFR
jgi:hypothetical protein